MGTLWFRDLNGDSDKAHRAMSSVYSVVVGFYNDELDKSVTSEAFNESIVSFNVFFDTCVFVLNDALITCKITLDFETGGITTTTDECNLIILSLCADTTNDLYYVDHFVFPEDKEVTFGFIKIEDGLDTSVTVQARPVIYSLDLETSEMIILYNSTSTDTDFGNGHIPTGSSTSVIHSAALTYNDTRRVYNITFARKDTIEGMFLFSYNIQRNNNVYDLLSVKVIEPL